MDLQLVGKRALITGSSGGIGEAITKVLAAEGAMVVVHGRNEKNANRVAEDVAAWGGKVVVAIGDLTIDRDAKQVTDQALSAFGGIDILVNNAATYEARLWSETEPENWLDTYNNNVVSVVRMVRHLASQMKTFGWGRIINIASSVATQPLTAMPDYASKAALLNLTVSLAKDLAKTGVTVNALGVGIVRTPHLEQYFLEVGKEREWDLDWHSIEQRVMEGWMDNSTGRLGSPEDIANLVAYLSSPLSGYINGANLRIDGGSTLTVN